MSVHPLDELKFLLKLQECRHHRAALTSPSFKSFAKKDKICQNLNKAGLVDFSREIATVKITPAGQALLKLPEHALPITTAELKVLHKLAAARKITPAQLTSSTLKAAARDALLQKFLERGLITVETQLKRQNAEVWLTPRGQDCLAQLVNQFQAIRQALPEGIPDSKPSDEEVLALIQRLDQEEATHNYLPIFYLRQKLQPLAREELDQILYRLQRNDKIELRAIVHTQDYTPEQISAGIEQRAGSPLFFIKVI
ncbi:MAG: transcription factor RcaD [Synechococcales cyanobacterium C42_A2020_086]|jgi:DNA-binding PadR family transcriptional regulator|nr:transcription factor RcaD [Synechococcales cyanobacterium M58_A2018_015]MBF2072635.1 transcription factor RcaD [Synechococcales cyanobacterium C42_A2020_086]